MKFRTIRFRCSRQDISFMMADLLSYMDEKRFEKVEDLCDEWQITLTHIERK